jgi:hypothetical protein
MTNANNDMPPHRPDENEPHDQSARDVLDFIDEAAARITDADVDKHLRNVLDQTGYRRRHAPDAHGPAALGGPGGHGEELVVSEAEIVDEGIDWEIGDEEVIDWEIGDEEDSPASVVPLPLSPLRDLGSAEGLGTGQPPGGRQSGAGAPDEIRIGLWGAPGSGKTTYLAALRHAMRVDPANGKWSIYPGNEFSSRFMADHTHNLVDNHRFPEVTYPGEVTPLRWHFVGDLAGSRFDKRKLRRRAPVPSEFVLSMADVSGEAYSENQHMPAEIADRALDHLASAQGLLYFFDPLAEREDSRSMAYLNRTITALSHRMRAEGQLVNRFLPHHVAVCITKFDHPEVFRQARRHGLVTLGPEGMPWVLGKDAEILFDMICDGSFWDDYEWGASSAWFVREELRQRFHPDRIHYFATSAIGFCQRPRRDPVTDQPSAFAPDDYANIYVRDDEELMVRGPIAPVNVFEPLLILQDGISGISRTRALRLVPSESAEENRRRPA